MKGFQYIFMLLFMVFAMAAFGQGSIKGKVIDANGDPVIGATVVLVQNAEKGVVSDINGNFMLQKLALGTLQLRLSSIGYTTKIIAVEVVAKGSSELEILLEENIEQLQEILIIGKSEATITREQAFAVELIETKKLNNTSNDLGQVLKRISGVNIRESGGLGSNFNLSLNGLSGKRVRSFIDGVPMDYFGSSLGLNNFPVNLISSVEVYKGAVPIHLSSDALGGAINISTTNTTEDYLDVSYAVSSFNTHRAAINAQAANKKNGLVFKLKSFYNHADNDYPIDIKLLDPNTGKLNETSTTVTRFHDRYASKMVWVQSGVVNKPFADALLLGALYSANHKEIQQNPYATGTTSFPVGEATSEESKWLYNLSYSKRGLFWKNLNFKTHQVFIDANEEYRDVSPHRYDWHGGFQANVHPTTGELGRKSHFFLNRINYLSNANLEYSINDRHVLAVNHSLNRLKLQGEDAFQPQNNTQYSTPNTVDKQIYAASYTNKTPNNSWSTTFFSKLYQYKLKANKPDYNGVNSNYFESSKDGIGYGLASAVFVSESIQIKGSFERAFRFPESEELYGDGLNIIPNPELKAEKSNNFNLGWRWNHSSGVKTYGLEMNFFVRDTEDYIRFKPQLTRSIFINETSVRSNGIDVTSYLHFGKQLQITFGGTYTNLRNNDENSIVYKDRLPNEPYLMGNVTVSFSQPGFLSKKNTLTVLSTNHYVHDFYLKYPTVAGQGKSVIDAQFTTNLELIYAVNSGKYNVSFLVSNALDAVVFDNFQQQKPGRAFGVKARYFISK